MPLECVLCFVCLFVSFFLSFFVCLFVCLLTESNISLLVLHSLSSTQNDSPLVFFKSNVYDLMVTVTAEVHLDVPGSGCKRLGSLGYNPNIISMLSHL